MSECDRCGDTFGVELCAVAGGAGAPRDRIEAYLCYKCRQETTHKRLTSGGSA